MIKNKKKILIVGEWTWPWYHEACAQEIKKLGWKVIKFKYGEDFRKLNKKLSDLTYHSIYHKLEFHIQQGPISLLINKKLLRRIRNEKPDYIWFYNASIITKRTIQKIKITYPEISICQFSNDNPFSSDANKLYWRHFIQSIKFYDHHFCYRVENILDYKKNGIKNPKLLRSYFLPNEDYPLDKSKIRKKYKCDVVFAGHYENDGRLEILTAICILGLKLNLYGGGWNRVLTNLPKTHPLKKFYPVYPATGEKYRQAICGSSVALCFLSKLNKDTYTRRNFQIPAMKVPVLSEYSKDLNLLFKKNEEIVFFKNKKECLKMLSWLIKNPKIRKNIAEKSYKKVYRDHHDVKSRMKQFIHDITTNSKK